MANINHYRIAAVSSICATVLVSTLAAHAAALPPDPNNAALLYYQALLRRPEPDDAAKVLVYDATREQIYKVLLGGKFEPGAQTRESIDRAKEMLGDSDPNKMKSEPWRNIYWSYKGLYDDLTEPYETVGDINPNEKVREYLKECKETIEYAEAAGRLPQCNWGFRYSQRYGPGTEVMVQWRSLARVLSVDALAIAADKDYRAALERCLTIRQLARHIPDDMDLSYRLSVHADNTAVRTLRHILQTTQLDVDTLTWLKTELASKSGAPQSPVRVMKMNFEFILQAMRTNDIALPWLRKQLVEDAQDASAKNKIRHLSDDDLLARAREPYVRFLDSVIQAIQSDMPYEDKYAKIQRVVDTFLKEADSNPAIIFSLQKSAGSTQTFYTIHMRHAARLNALRTAIEIYLARAKTGQLPETLPAGSPKDPYSEKDFEYERMKEGFVLRCRVKDIDVGKAQQYEFKVQE